MGTTITPDVRWFHDDLPHSSGADVPLPDLPLPESRRRLVAPRPRGVSRPRARRARALARASSRSGDSGDDDPHHPEPAPRLCSCGCGRSLEGKRRDALAFDGSCRMRLTRQRQQAAESLRPLAMRGCRCGSNALFDRDPDGDLLCVRCGHHSGPLSRPNGYDAIAALMASNGVWWFTRMEVVA
jgi:hypothetical protein